jgi:hypothetical protein
MTYAKLWALSSLTMARERPLNAKRASVYIKALNYGFGLLS